MKIILQAALALGLVLLSLHPSLTNRADSLLSQPRGSIAAAVTPANMHSSTGHLRYRGSFEQTEKRGFGLLNVWSGVLRDSFFVPGLRSQGPGPIAVPYLVFSPNFRILRI
jgi:hypothetical protein